LDHKGTADSAVTIRVNPTVLFNLGIEVREGKSSLGSFSSELWDSEIGGAKSHVQSKSEDGLSSRGADLFDDSESRAEEFGGKDFRETVVRSVDPSEHEVVVAIRSTFELQERVVSGSGVELSSILRLKWEPGDHEVSISSPLHPLLVGVDLNVDSGPVPSSLGLNNEGFTVDLEDHDTMSNVTSSTPFDDLIKTIESSNGQEVSRLEEGFIELNNDVLRSFKPLVSSSILDELDVALDLFGSGLASKERNVGAKSESSEEQPDGLDKIREEISGLVTHSEDEQTSFLNLSHFCSIDLDGGFVTTREHDGIDVVVGQSGEEVSIGTIESGTARDGMIQLNGLIVRETEGHTAVLPARSTVGDSGVLLVEVTNEHGEHSIIFSMELVRATDKSFILDLSEVVNVVVLGEERSVEVFEMLVLAEETTFGELND